MRGIYDIHCHLIPGVDDGAENLEITKKLLKKEYEQGVRTIFLTSHYRLGMFETPMEVIQERFQQVKLEAQNVSPDLQVLLGCEFHACMDMAEILRRGERPTMGGSRFVLVEFSGLHDFRFIRERCYDLLCHGYKPIIAHAERSPALYKRFDCLEELVELGVYIQMNADSILGNMGFWMKLFCKKAMEKKLLHFVGSDAHDLSERSPKIGACAEYIEKVMGKAYAKRIFVKNPRMILKEIES